MCALLLLRMRLHVLVRRRTVLPLLARELVGSASILMLRLLLLLVGRALALRIVVIAR
jgi:hypothetical protein